MPLPKFTHHINRNGVAIGLNLGCDSIGWYTAALKERSEISLAER